MLMKDGGITQYDVKSLKANSEMPDNLFVFDTKGLKADQISDERDQRNINGEFLILNPNRPGKLKYFRRGVTLANLRQKRLAIRKNFRAVTICCSYGSVVPAGR